MEMFGKIRRMYLRDKLSLHEITKRTGLSRNTIGKWFRDSKEAAPPTYHRRDEPGKLAAFHETLEQALKADSHRAKQNRRTAKDLFAQIKLDGYVGGYSQLTAFIRDLRGREGKAPHAFVPLKFELGEALCARLLTMNVAHYEMKYGAMLLEDILTTTQSGMPNDQQAELMAKGTETLVGMLGNVMQGFDEQVSH